MIPIGSEVNEQKRTLCRMLRNSEYPGVRFFAAVELAMLFDEQPELATAFDGVFDQEVADAVMQAFDSCYQHKHEVGLGVSIRLLRSLFSGRRVVYSTVSIGLNRLRNDTTQPAVSRQQAEDVLKELNWPLL